MGLPVGSYHFRCLGTQLYVCRLLGPNSGTPKKRNMPGANRSGSDSGFVSVNMSSWENDMSVPGPPTEPKAMAHSPKSRGKAV